MCGRNLVLCFATAVVLFCVGRGVMATVGHYTHTWSVHIEGGPDAADLVAQELGFVNLGKIVDDHYHFLHKGVEKRSISPAHHHHHQLNNHDRVKWVRQERILSRKKRDFIPLVKKSTLLAKNLTLPLLSRSGRTSHFHNRALTTSETYSDSGNRSDRDLSHSTSAERRARLTIPINSDSYFPLNDQRWPEMWYLNRGGGLDMNVVEAWKEGITGKGVVVTILDDGLEKDHPDLIVNYDPQASYDVNNHDEDPMPRYDMIDSNRHGTRCAGEVAATANNSLCAVGIAYGANVGGVRMLDGDVTDAVEARSLSLNPQHIDIYSASWGPDDDGKTVDGPGELATRAFMEGVTKGRNGKGSIFVWASGNGGNDRDNCNCDGYTNSIWTLSISSATENGEVPWYSEMCSSTLATTYSSGSSSEKQVVTTDLHHSCTSSHTGTSASAPLAAGICALALEANPELTWRDMQHIVVRTAKPANLQHTTWKTNGVGRNVSHSFGYGLMDAAAMVRLARIWRTVPAQHRCEVSAPHTDKSIPAKSQVVLQLVVNQCVGVNYLEHVQAKISLTASRRGDMEINLISPAGTRVTLLATRSHDTSRAGFTIWPFMSVHTWGESPYGIWQLEVHNEGKFMGRAMLQDWSLIFHGTSGPADKNDPSPYNNINYKINISQSLLVPSITLPSNKNRNNKNSGKAQANVNNIASPYVVNTNGNPRKNKNLKNSHRNSQGKNKSSIKPTVTSLRGITNKTSTYSKQYGNGKGPQRQTDSRLSAISSKSVTTEGPKQWYTTVPNVTKLLKLDKTTKSYKANILEASTHTMKIQKNVSKQPNADPKSNNPRANVGNKKSPDTATTRMYQTVPPEDTSTNAPNFRGFIFIDQPPDGHVGLINPKIPSLFQKYPKIQHIYPALFPYPKVEVVGNKPSRQHPPLSQFHPEHGYIGGLVSQDSMDSEMDHHESRIYSDNKASLTQWDMIFYGTDPPPQEEPNYNTRHNPGLLQSDLVDSVVDSDVDQHNLIDENRSSDKWGDSQKVRDEGRNDPAPRRPAANTQDARGGCLSHVSAQSSRCIECHQEFYLYTGQCYRSCPEKTFPSPTFSSEILKPKTLTVGSVEPVSSLKKKRAPINMDHFKNFAKPLENGREFRPMSNRDILRPIPPKYCIDCHYSCLTCSGPYVYQCTSCPGDAELVNTTSGVGKIKESYCYPSHILPEINDTLWLHRFYVMFGIAIFAFICVIAYFLLYRLMTGSNIFQKSRKDVNNTSSVISYNRLGDADLDKKGVNIQKEISTAIFDNSDSDSEGPV